MSKASTSTLVLPLLLFCGIAVGDETELPVDWKIGVASVKITPDQRLHMAGYAGRKEPVEGTEQDLFGKAIAIEDRDGDRIVMVTLDLIGVIDRLRADVAKQVEEKYILPPHALLMNASHTHCGPAYAWLLRLRNRIRSGPAHAVPRRPARSCRSRTL